MALSRSWRSRLAYSGLGLAVWLGAYETLVIEFDEAGIVERFWIYRG